MKYNVERNADYDFLNQSYASKYPNLHRYPATMLPQIGIKLFKDFNVKKGSLLDPYCGSGSSFSSGLEFGMKEMRGFDINPLAVLISKTKFTKIDINSVKEKKNSLKSTVFEFVKKKDKLCKLPLPKITNIDYWFSKKVIKGLRILHYFIFKIKDESLKNFFLLPFSETIRNCSYTRNKEFKLYKMSQEDVSKFNPNVFDVYFKKIDDTISIYSNVYFPKLTEKVKINVTFSKFSTKPEHYDAVLTSPPYGDSKTTVAYGQFSTLSNEWLGIDYARKIDSMLMGGRVSKKLFENDIMSEQISQIAYQDERRALEISAFYRDLKESIKKVSKSVKGRGKVFYIIGNRTVKNIQLKTDQFIAEQFEKNNFKHITTIKRALSNKTMPSKNSPTNKKGKKMNTILFEHIVVCQKI